VAEDVNLSRLKSFINECGAVTLAAWKLGVRPSTLNKLLAGRPLSAPTREKFGDILEDNSTSKLPKGKDHLKIIRSKLREIIKNEIDLIEDALENLTLTHEMSDLSILDFSPEDLEDLISPDTLDLGEDEDQLIP